MWKYFAAVMLCLALAVPSRAAELSQEESFALLGKLAPALTVVEVTLQFDKAEAPPEMEHIMQERPMVTPAFLLEPTMAVCPFIPINPRFIKSIVVKFGQETRDARVISYAKTRAALFLQFDKPLPGAVPLKFDPKAAGPFYSVSLSLDDGHHGALYSLSVSPFAPHYVAEDNGRRKMTSEDYELIVNKEGVPAGMMMGDSPLNDGWKGSPLEWTKFSAEEMQKLLAALEKRCDTGLLHITLYFRSPTDKPESRRRRYGGYGADGEQKVQQECLGLLLDDSRILAPIPLEREDTARLERVVIHLPDGTTAAGKFTFNFRDYAGMMVTSEKPLAGALALNTADIRAVDDECVFAADMRVMGETLVRRFEPTFIRGYSIGWKGHLSPYAAMSEGDVLLFDEQGKLIAMPLPRREWPSEENRGRYGRRSYYSGRDGGSALPCMYLADLVRDPAKFADADNVPLPEGTEPKLAWLGVDVQQIGSDLARANKVSELTLDGETGAMVTYVYPGSPAAKAGIEVGQILLQLHIPDRSAPVAINGASEESEQFPYGFPWDRLDNMSEDDLDQIPTPWPSLKSVVNKDVTHIGFGRKFVADFIQNGKIVAKEFEVAECPPTFSVAPKYKSAALGMTVRDMTFDTRRYFQKKDEDPGVIVGKMEPGSKAFLGGVRPFEIITQVNDQQVKNVQEFEKAVTGQAELRFALERMHKRRVVRLKLDAPKPAEAAKPNPENAAP